MNTNLRKARELVKELRALMDEDNLVRNYVDAMLGYDEDGEDGGDETSVITDDDINAIVEAMGI